MTEDGEIRIVLPGGKPLRPTLEDTEPTDGEEREGLDVGEPEAPRIERGAAIEGDEDAMAAAADTLLDMEGFETGAGFDLDDSPAEVGQDLEVETLAVTSNVFDELDEDEIPSTAEPGAGDLVAGMEDGGSRDVDLAVSGTAETVAGAATEDWDDDPTVDGGDEGPGVAPTHASGKPVREARLLGLEELEKRQKRRAGKRRLLTAASAALIIGGGFAMAYFGVVEIPGITFPDRSDFDVSPPVTLSGPQPETPVMSHVVFVDVWREAEMPLAWATALRERMPDLLGFVTALSIDGERQYALVVGPAYSEVEANGLKGPLTTAFDLLNPDPDSWRVQEAPYSFFFGEYESLGEANGRVEELADLSIPAYVLQVTYSAGASALRVYGGAFSDEFQAGEMGRLLNENDLGDMPLIERRGRLPA